MERAILVGLDITSKRGAGLNAEESLAELKTLAESAGVKVEHSMIQARPARDSATLIGSGKLEELGQHADFYDAGVVIFDSDLTPTQQRNLERALDLKVLDRTQLILDICARRARTREGQLQVELAQLSYALPRLTGRGIAMSRLGGGIGTRGPGETQLETDRRRIHGRIKRLNDDLASVRAGRGTQRKQRQAVPLATVALVGYTNAGKSTLFNRLTNAGVLADAKMFATLDPTVRHIVLPSRRRVLLSDTVGFIRNLPTTLVEAFRATLEEVTEAALLLHVVDASAPHASEHTAHVMKVLTEIGAGETRQILVLNKMDLLQGGSANPIETGQRILGETDAPAEQRAAAVSAFNGEGIAELLALVDQVLPFDPICHLALRIPASDGGMLHLLHERGRVVSSKYVGDQCEIEADVPESLKKTLAPYVRAPEKPKARRRPVARSPRS